MRRFCLFQAKAKVNLSRCQVPWCHLILSTKNPRAATPSTTVAPKYFVGPVMGADLDRRSQRRDELGKEGARWDERLGANSVPQPLLAIRLSACVVVLAACLASRKHTEKKDTECFQRQADTRLRSPTWLPCRRRELAYLAYLAYLAFNWPSTGLQEEEGR